jgi:hypothetical protein
MMRFLFRLFPWFDDLCARFRSAGAEYDKCPFCPCISPIPGWWTAADMSAHITNQHSGAVRLWVLFCEDPKSFPNVPTPQVGTKRRKPDSKTPESK